MGTKTVYVAEDDPSQLELFRVFFELRKDFAPSFFSDGLEVYHKVHDEPPDCLVLDIILPSLSGLEITRLLKFHDDYKKIPILIISSITDQDIQTRAITAGANAFLPKPFAPEQFMEALDKLL